MRIVIVEDEMLIREGMSNTLQKIDEHYQVVGTAENGVHGLEVIENVKPDLVIMDIRMPDMDGLEMLSRLRRQGNSCKVIVLSAYSEFDYAKRAIDLGIENYLLKPVKIPELRKVLQELEENIQSEVKKEKFFSLENVFRGNVTGQFTADDQMNNVAEQEYGLRTDEDFFVLQIRMKQEYERYRYMLRALLEEADAHNNTFQSCILEFPDRFVSLMIVYQVEGQDKIKEYFEKSVLPVICSQIKGRVVFVWKQCKGLRMIYPGILEMRKELEWCLVFGRGALISQERIQETAVSPIKYPIDIETQAKQAIIHDNEKEFHNCARKMRSHCQAMAHTPQEIKETCVRYSMALFQSAKESGKMMGEFSTQDTMNMITGALTWEEIDEAFGRFFASLIFQKEDDTSVMIQRAKLLIREYYNQGITLEEIAHRLYVTEEYLSSQFKKETGKTFSETIRGYRIKKVKELLLKSSLKLNQISDMAGYSDPKYMSKVFREEVGVSPAEYRKLNS